MTATINASTTAGVVTTADTSGILQLQTNGTAALTVDASQNVGIGTASPTARLTIASGTNEGAVRVGDNATYYGAFARVQATDEVRLGSYGASQNLTFYTVASERMRITSAGLVGIGTASPNASVKLTVSGAGSGVIGGLALVDTDAYTFSMYSALSALIFRDVTNAAERMRIDSSGSLLVGKTASSFATAGVEINAGGGNFCRFTRDGGALADFNRLTNDGELVGFWQATTQEGSISVSGTTVSYNGGHLSRWAQTTTAKDDTLVKGTVLSNLDEMNVYTDADGNSVDNEQLNKVKVSDVEGDANVAGVFVNWSHDDAHDVDEINMAMTGDMIIRIAQGTTVARGDLLMSAGDGTAKPQGDDIVRSKTVAKVTSTHVTCTYADGSYCVPCVLMAC